MTKTKKTPMRMCVGCREMKPKQELIRILRTPEGEIKADASQKASGRGAYLCHNAECLKKSIKTNALARSLDTPIGQEIFEKLEKEING